MKLSYRGTQYDRVSLAIKGDVSETKGKYRGASWKSQSIAPVFQSRNNSKRTYRGIDY